MNRKSQSKISVSQRKKLPIYVAMLSSAAFCASTSLPSFAQTTSDSEEEHIVEEVIVTGMRASIQSAQDLKRDAAVIQDSIVAEDIGKLPDRSIAEALQRVPGVAVSRFDSPSDPEHFAGEGAGVSIRGLTQVRAELNGRDIFSANDGRALSFDDVPAELMAGVDVIKSPTADMVEGGLGGIVNLRTRMPFDQDEQLISGTVKVNYGDIIEEANLEGSILYSNVWDTPMGRFGMLVDFSNSTVTSRADNLYVRAYFPRTADAPYGNALVGDKYSDETYYVPRGADWRRNDFERKRNGQYIAMQWEPNDDLELYLTAFSSNAKREWFENGFFIDAGGGFPDYLPIPGTPIVEGDGDAAQVVGYESDDWVFDGNNAFVSGTITAPAGVPFGTSSRLSSNESTTTDISTGAEWNSGPWTVSGDFQRVISSAEKEDFTYGTVTFPSEIRFEDLGSSDGPSIYDVNNHLADLSNYSFGQMMSQPADNHANSTAVKLDIEYEFEESIINSVKAGVRFAEREANNKSVSNWSARVQPWNTCCWDQIPTISADNPLMRQFSFDDFQRGDVDVPVTGWMFTEAALADFAATTNAMVEQTTPPDWATWVASSPNWDLLDLDNPANVSKQEDTSTAAYLMTSFSFGDVVSGNVGVRYVESTLKSAGYVQYSTFETPDGSLPYYKDPAFLEYENDYDFVLPSLNLRFYATDELVFRFSASKQIWKPEFWRTAATQNFSAGWNETTSEEDRADPDFVFDPSMVDLSLSNDTNPSLDPMTAVQLDLTAEWYFNDNGGMVYAGLFNKKVEDLFRIQTRDIDFEEWSNVQSRRVVNIGEADVNGLELGGTYYFDSLPEPFNGLGIAANYTYIDSDSDLPIESGAEPIDTDDTEILDIPLEGLAEETYNLTLMYEWEGFYTRLAYNWHSEVFQSIGPNGWNGNNYDIAWRLPVYADDYGQLDLSMGYEITENFSVNFEAYNLTQADTKGYMRQNGAGDHLAYIYTNDTRYGLSLRVTF